MIFTDIPEPTPLAVGDIFRLLLEESRRAGHACKMYVIFDRPDEFPGHYVVRLAVAVDGKPVEQCNLMIANSLMEARCAIPEGYECFPRSDEDEESVVETWI